MLPVILMATVLCLGGCGSTEPAKYGIAWRDADPDLARYTRIIVEPVEIDRTTGASFGGASDRELQRLAELTRHVFVSFARPYITSFPGPGVARLKLTLAGLANNVAIVAALSHGVLIGPAMRAPERGLGRPGAFSGSVTLIAELFDTESGAPLGSRMQKHHPPAADIGATFDSQIAHEAAITEAAKAFRKWLDELHEGAR